MEDPDFAATEARRKFYQNEITYNNQRATNEEYGARTVSMDQAQIQALAYEDRETVRREQALRVLRGEENNDVGSDVE